LEWILPTIVQQFSECSSMEDLIAGNSYEVE